MGGADPVPGVGRAEALVEHVIGFHEFLVLRPAGIRAARPRHDPVRRWHAAAAAIEEALASPALDRPADYFDGASRAPRELLGALTTDVLVHTWDLARAVGGADRLDPELCERGLRDAEKASGSRAASGLFGPPVPVPDRADPQARLLGLLGRDPSWRPNRAVGR